MCCVGRYLWPVEAREGIRLIQKGRLMREVGTEQSCSAASWGFAWVGAGRSYYLEI